MSVLYAYVAGLCTAACMAWLEDNGWMLTLSHRLTIAVVSGLLWPLVAVAALVVWVRGRRG